MAIDYTDPIQTRGLRDHLISKGYKQTEIDSLISRRAVSQNPDAYINAGMKPEQVIEAAGGMGTPGGLRVANVLKNTAKNEPLELAEQERKFVVGYSAALKARQMLDPHIVTDANGNQVRKEGVQTGPLATTLSKAKEMVQGGKIDEGTNFRANLALAQTALKSAFIGTQQTSGEMKGLIDALGNPYAQEQTIKAKLDQLIGNLGIVIKPEAKEAVMKAINEVMSKTSSGEAVTEEQINAVLNTAQQKQSILGATPGALPADTTGLPPTPGALVDNEMLGNPPPDLATIVLNQATAKKKETPVGEEDTFQRMLEGENLPHPAGIITNLPKSIANVVGSFVDAMVHPVRTLEAAIGTVAGGVEKLIPGEQRGEKFFDAFTQYIKERYGNPDKFYTTLVNDPAGTLLDIVSVVDLGATAAKTLGGDVAKSASIVQNAVAKADVIDQGLKGASYLASKTPTEVSIGLPGASKSYLAEVGQLADELAVDMPASALTESRTVRNVEAIAQNAVFGNKVSSKILQAENRLRELGVKLRDEVVRPVNDVDMGLVIKDSYAKYIDSFRELKNNLYNEVPTELLKTINNPEETMKLLQAIIDDKKMVAGGDPAIKYYQKMLKDMKAKVAESKWTIDNTLKTRQSVRNKMGNVGDAIATGDKGTLTRLEAQLYYDLDTAIKGVDPALGKGLETANAYYRDTIKKINSQIGRTIASSNPENIVNRIFKPNSQTNIIALKELMGDSFQQVQASFFQKLVAESLDTKNGLIDIYKLRKNMKNYGFTTLKEGLGPELSLKLAKLADEADKIQKLKTALKTGTIPAIGSRTAFLGSIYGMASVVFVNPLLFIKLLGGDWALSSITASSWGKKLLTAGYKVKMPKGINMEQLFQKARPMGRITRFPEQVNLQLEQNQQQEVLPAIPQPLP